jgi:hypothetical protein
MQHNVQTGKLQYSEKNILYSYVEHRYVTVLSMLVFVVLIVVLFNVVAPLREAQGSSFQ